MQIRRGTLYMLIIGSIVIGGAIGYAISYTVDRRTAVPEYVRANLADYKFINPLLTLRTEKNLYEDEFQNLNGRVKAYISGAEAEGKIEVASFYYRDLNNGHWTGVNEDTLYQPSSMLKVVALMAVLKMSEYDQSILSKKLKYEPNEQSSEFKQYYLSSTTLAPGYHRVDELLTAMIVHSDNVAAVTLLGDQTIHEEFDKAYAVFRLPGVTAITTASTVDDFMSPRSYSVLYRALYSSAFLQWGVSEQVLKFLTQTTFKNGLVAGVPLSVMVSHKFGENERTTDGRVTRELHDCGIVYYPERPYFICVMTKGGDFESLEKIIADISRITYDYIHSLSE